MCFEVKSIGFLAVNIYTIWDIKWDTRLQRVYLFNPTNLYDTTRTSAKVGRYRVALSLLIWAFMGHGTMDESTQLWGEPFGKRSLKRREEEMQDDIINRRQTHLWVCHRITKEAFGRRGAFGFFLNIYIVLACYWSLSREYSCVVSQIKRTVGFR